MNKNYAVSGKSVTLKHYADVNDTIAAIKRIVRENYPAVADLAQSLQGDFCRITFQNIWDFVRRNIRYENDEPGKEQLRTPQRTLHDATGDCDDMSILISCILTNLGHEHELWVTAYKKQNSWQHIYTVAYDRRGERYVIDCVPEIPYFNYEAQPIKNKIVINMRLEELGQAVSTDMISELTQPFEQNMLQGCGTEEDQMEAIGGLLGTVAIVDEQDGYQTVLSGSELQSNIILKQLMEAKTALENEVKNPTDMSQLNDNRIDLGLIVNIINNFNDEDARDEAIDQAIGKGTLYLNFYKAVKYGLDDVVNGLAGEDDDDLYYLQVMEENDLYEDVDGIGILKKLRKNIKEGMQKLKEKHPKLAKIGHALKKYNPATFTIRKSMEVFMKANVFSMAEKLSIGYATEGEAAKQGYSKAEYQEFVKAKDQAEQKWFALGGEKEHFRKMIQNSRGARKAGLKGQMGVAPGIISAITSAFGAVIEMFKKLRLKKKDGSYREDTNTESEEIMEKTKSIGADTVPSTETETENANIKTDEKSGVTTEVVTDANGNQTTIYRDKDGNEISRFKAFLLKNKTLIIIVSIILVLGIVALVIWKIRQRALRGLGEAGISAKQENFIKRQGLNNRAYASLIREEIKRDKKPYNQDNRKAYYKKVFSDAFSRPLSQKQVSAAQNYNGMYREVRQLAKQKGGGSAAWKEAWKEVKKKR
ncbi:MAG: hypothetical protein A2W91_05515 [Bacteroidetes bacterium GWF2_38_335]|nr:MAG: hypothetical protein A2W91_05515 [Bacteroidetes bacterium GWF2_38_335]HBS88098.1 hypothetical protein [Bacteroidales bacterium]